MADLPITVEAQLPNAPEQTLRQRLEAIRKEYCWRGHERMGPPGEGTPPLHVGKYCSDNNLVNILFNPFGNDVCARRLSTILGCAGV